MIPLPNLLEGIPIEVTPWLTVPETRRYTWLERLLTANIPPWEKYYTVQIPSRQIVYIGGRYIMHPQTFRALQEYLDNSTVSGAHSRV